MFSVQVGSFSDARMRLIVERSRLLLELSIIILPSIVLGI